MQKRANLLLLVCLAALCGATTTSGAPVPITFGRDIKKLQDLVDERYGRNHIDVTKDFIGARGEDIDPWFWVGSRTGAVRVKVLRRNSDSDLGWYEETGDQARMPDGGGVLFTGRARRHEEAVLPLPGFQTRFGFYVDATLSTSGAVVSGPGSGANITKRFFTNRRLNDCGPNGTGAIHAPFDGDVQALMYDVSRWVGPDTWLVCFEDQDTGGLLADGDDGDDDDRAMGTTFAKPKEDDDDGDDDDHGRDHGSNNDFNDVVLEVRADGATPTHALSFGGLKLRYR